MGLLPRWKKKTADLPDTKLFKHAVLRSLKEEGAEARSFVVVYKLS